MKREEERRGEERRGEERRGGIERMNGWFELYCDDEKMGGFEGKKEEKKKNCWKKGKE